VEAYDKAAQASAFAVIHEFSSSFGIASRLFPKPMRQHIYNIYGMVRLADEIVDSYGGNDAAKLLSDLEQETYQAIQRGFSSNLVLHAFAETACTYNFDTELIRAFYVSMHIDADPTAYNPARYAEYIYGSAEVVGLMCLKVFCDGNQSLYDELAPGARALGSAFQKVNFLRDIHADHQQLGRYYFPAGSYEQFDDAIKQQILQDIRQDFGTALPAIRRLPYAARPPVMAAYRYYAKLLGKLEAAPAEVIRMQRLRIGEGSKLVILAMTIIRERLGTR